MKKRVLSILFAFCLLLCLMPTAAFAEDSEDVAVCKVCEKSDYLIEAGFVMNYSDRHEGHHQKYLCYNHPVGIACIGEKLYPHTFENEKCTGCGYTCEHSYENGVCKSCGKVCAHNSYSWRVENGEYWEECSGCGMIRTAKQTLPDLKLNAPDKVCRNQDYVFTFILPDGCTEPGYSWEFSKKGDGAEATPVDGVCTVTVKSEYYVDSENTFKITAGAFIGGVYFSESKTVTIVDGHEGGTATCTDPAVCEICGQSYGDVDPGNHDLVHHEAKAATKESEGNIEYWYCNDCEKYFADKDGKKEIAQADTVIGKLPAAPASDQKKDQNATGQKKDHNAETGDSSDPALWFAMMLLSGGAAAGVTIARKKRSFEK